MTTTTNLRLAAARFVLEHAERPARFGADVELLLHAIVRGSSFALSLDGIKCGVQQTGKATLLTRRVRSAALRPFRVNCGMLAAAHHALHRILLVVQSHALESYRIDHSHAAASASERNRIVRRKSVFVCCLK